VGRVASNCELSGSQNEELIFGRYSEMLDQELCFDCRKKYQLFSYCSIGIITITKNGSEILHRNAFSLVK